MDKFDFLFVAVTADGDVYCPQYHLLKGLDDFGDMGYQVVGLIPESSEEGFGFTLIMQRHTRPYPNAFVWEPPKPTKGTILP